MPRIILEHSIPGVRDGYSNHPKLTKESLCQYKKYANSLDFPNIINHIACLLFIYIISDVILADFPNLPKPSNIPEHGYIYIVSGTLLFWDGYYNRICPWVQSAPKSMWR